MDPNIPPVCLLLPSLFIFKLNPGWTPQGSRMVEWHYTCSPGPDWKHVEVKSLLRYPRHVRESQHQAKSKREIANAQNKVWHWEQYLNQKGNITFLPLYKALFQTGSSGLLTLPTFLQLEGLRGKWSITSEVTARLSRARSQSPTWMMFGPGTHLACTRTQMFDCICWGSFSAVSSDLLPFEVKVCATSQLSGCQLRARLCVSGPHHSPSACEMM